MHVYRVTYWCNPSAYNEVTGLLKARVKEYLDTGRFIMLESEVAGPEKGGYRHQLISFFDSLAPYGRFVASMQAQGVDEATVKYLRQIEPLLNSPIRYELWEAAVPFKPAGRPLAGEFVLRESWYPRTGDTAGFRTSAIDFVRRSQAEGRDIALYWQDLSPDSPVAQVLVRYRRLEDLEADTVRSRSGAGDEDWVRAHGPMTRRGNSMELWSVVTDPPEA
jgi:hypothetical protein